MISCGDRGLIFWDPFTLVTQKHCKVVGTLCDVAPYGRYALAVSTTGNLLIFAPEYSVAMRVIPLNEEAFAVSYAGDFIITGGANGKLQLFHATDLAHLSVFPRPPPIGMLNVTSQGDLDYIF